MDMQSYRTDKISIVELSGRPDAISVAGLKTYINDLSCNQPIRLLIDLTNVTLMDSGMLAVIIQGMRTCRCSGGDLCLLNPNQSVRRIFEETRLDKTISIYVSKAEAIASFNDE